MGLGTEPHGRRRGPASCTAFADPAASYSQQSASCRLLAGELDGPNMTINNGNAIRVGATKQVTAPVTFTMTHGDDVDPWSDDFYVDPYIYKGSFDAPENILFGDDYAYCTPAGANTADCEGTIDIRPDYGNCEGGDLINSDAGAWTGGAYAIDFNGEDPSDPNWSVENVGWADQGNLQSTAVLRYAKMTGNAGPEPISKGATLTMTGKLTRANWETHTYKPYTGKTIKFQFKKSGYDSYATLNALTTDAYGNVKTSAKANYDGNWRLKFYGSSTSNEAKIVDYVDVQ